MLLVDVPQGNELFDKLHCSPQLFANDIALFSTIKKTEITFSACDFNKDL